VNNDQRKFISDKLGNLGNFVFIAFVIGQFISKDQLQFFILITGLIFWLVCYIVGYIILKGGE